MRRRRLLLRLGAVMLSLVLGGAFIAYRVQAARNSAPASEPDANAAHPGAAVGPADSPAPLRPMLPGSKSMEIFSPQPPEQEPTLMHSTKRGVIVSPEDLRRSTRDSSAPTPPISAPIPPTDLSTPDRLGPP